MARLPISLVLMLSASLASGCDKTPAETKAAGGEAEPAAADQAKGEAAAEAKGEVYGAPLAEGTPMVTIAEVMDDPKAFEGKVVRVTGMVTDVCTMRGCWFEMAGERPGMKMRFKVRDGDMVFPPSAKGKTAVAEGTVSVKTMTLEQTREYEVHMAKEAGRELDPETITEPMVLVMLMGKGAVIRDS